MFVCPRILTKIHFQFYLFLPIVLFTHFLSKSGVVRKLSEEISTDSSKVVMATTIRKQMVSVKWSSRFWSVPLPPMMQCSWRPVTQCCPEPAVEERQEGEVTKGGCVKTVVLHHTKSPETRSLSEFTDTHSSGPGPLAKTWVPCQREGFSHGLAWREPKLPPCNAAQFAEMGGHTCLLHVGLCDCRNVLLTFKPGES